MSIKYEDEGIPQWVKDLEGPPGDRLMMKVLFWEFLIVIIIAGLLS